MASADLSVGRFLLYSGWLFATAALAYLYLDASYSSAALLIQMKHVTRRLINAKKSASDLSDQLMNCSHKVFVLLIHTLYNGDLQRAPLRRSVALYSIIQQNI